MTSQIIQAGSSEEVDMNKQLVILGENIRTLRKDLGISQDELAFRCGLHRTYISEVERGNRNLTFNSLLAIAQRLGLPVPELTRNIGADPRASEKIAEKNESPLQKGSKQP